MNDHPIAWDRACLLLGAGFSHDLGMPLALELSRELTDWLTPAKLQELYSEWSKSPAGSPIPAKILPEIQAALKLPNYELTIGAMERRFIATRETGYDVAAAWLTKMVNGILMLRHADNADRLPGIARFYSGLTAVATRAAPFWIFSLNHDVLVELIADDGSLRWTSGFGQDVASYLLRNDGTTAERVLLRVVPESGLRTGMLEFINNGPGINLVKLHGSLDLFQLNDRRDFAVLNPDAKGRDRLRLVGDVYQRSAHFFSGQQIHALGETVVTDDVGEMQFLRHTLLSGAHKFTGTVGQNAPPELLEVFADKLASFEHLVAIGYGFTDAHVNERILAWLDADSSRMLFIVDPFRTTAPPGFEAFVGRTVLRQTKAIEFLDHEGAVTRSPREQAELRLFRAGRPVSKDEREQAFVEEMRAGRNEIVAALTKLVEDGVVHEGMADEDAENVQRSLVPALEDRLVAIAERLERIAEEKKTKP